MKIKSKNNGITLISLVITIIIMLILVGVSINLAVNGGLFEYAGNAVGDTKNAMKQEQDLIDDIIENHIKPNVPSGDETIDGNDGEKFSKIYEQTTKITQTEGDKTYTAWIPKGFSVGTSEEISKISTGLVIRDAEGNEFVWIPVKVTESDTEKNIASFYRSNWTSSGRGTSLKDNVNLTEPYASGYLDGEGTEETTDYNGMLKSVYTYEGFYIGRYEAGTDTARTNTSNRTSNMVVQRDKYPYIYVGWGAEMTDYTGPITYSNNKQGLGALALSKRMYPTKEMCDKDTSLTYKDVGVTSTLCYGVMWDAMLDFIIKDSSYSVTNSTTWGNYYNNTGDTWKITRTTASYSEDYGTTWNLIDDEENDIKEKTSSSSILLTTGANDKFSSKNIYDVAGNVYEWTNEAYSTNDRVLRGGYYCNHGDYNPASYRNLDVGPYNCGSSLGFRPALYITNND